MEAVVLGIDQGTSATKAVVVTEGNEVLARVEIPVHPRAVEGGGVEQEPEELWDSVIEAGRQAVARAGVEIDAVGLANQGETVVAWNTDTGDPHGPALVWQDRRSLPVCERLAAAGWDRRLAEITGLELDPYFAAPKIAWLREQGVEGGAITTSDAWLLHRLCGAYVTDAATASRWLLLDLDTVEWSPDACRAFGLDPAELPAVVDCDAAVGETSAFGRTVPLCGLAVDQQAALFAESCLEHGDAKCTYGTGAFLLATVGGRPVRSRSGLAACVAWRLGGRSTWCLDGQVFTVGSAVRWLQDVGLLDGPGDLDRLGGTVAGPDGVTFVPSLAGLGAPFWVPEARGALTGLSLATTRAHVARAVVEGVAAQVAWLVRAASDDLGTPLARLRVDGGLTRSHVLMQVQADLAQVPVEVYASPDATALGAVALARLGCGAAPDAASAVGPWTPAAVYEPTITPDEAEARLVAWRGVAEASLRL